MEDLNRVITLQRIRISADIVLLILSVLNLILNLIRIGVGVHG